MRSRRPATSTDRRSRARRRRGRVLSRRLRLRHQQPRTLPLSHRPIPSASPVDDNHSETAWRLRHLRRGILKDVTVPDVLLAGDGAPAGANVFEPSAGQSGSSARLATNLFSGVPFTGQVNLLTTGSFDSPRELFTSDNFSRSIAYFSLAAPARRAGGLVDAWRVDAGRYLVLVHRRRVRDAAACASPVRPRSVLQHAAIRRRQSRCAARSHRRQPQRRRGIRLRYFHAHAGDRRDLRSAVLALRLSGREHAPQPARRADVVAGQSFPAERARVEPRPRARRGGVPAARSIRGCGCRRNGRSPRSSRDDRSARDEPTISRSRRSAISARRRSRCAPSASASTISW